MRVNAEGVNNQYDELIERVRTETARLRRTGNLARPVRQGQPANSPDPVAVANNHDVRPSLINLMIESRKLEAQYDNDPADLYKKWLPVLMDPYV